MDTEETDTIDFGVDEQLSRIFNNQVSLVNPVASVSEQQVSLNIENCQKNELKDGDCYIFNYEEFYRMAPRKGSEKDAERLKHDFTQLNLDVHPHTNLLYDETFNALKEASSKNYSKSKYFVCCFLTHGCQNTLWAKDRSMNIDDILAIFSESSSLKGIPKIFIIQACRGKEPELPISKESTDSGFLTETEEYLDFLIVNSTYLDTVSFKTCDEEPEKCHGSFFIDEFCRSLEQFSGTLDLFQILTIVNDRMANIFLSHCMHKKELDKKKQMSCFTSTLRKKVEFNRNIEQFDNIDTQYFENRRKKHGSRLDSINYPLIDSKYDIKKAKRVLFLSIVNEKIGEESISLRKAIYSLWTDFVKRKYNYKDFRNNFKKSEISKFLKGSNLFGVKNESIAGKSSEIDCLICYIAAYSRYDSICDAEGRKISKKEIVEKFIGQRKKSLVGKPKIFIFLLCKSLENENLPSERFCKDDLKPTTESNIKTESSCERFHISADTVDGNIDNMNLIDSGCVGGNLIPVHADILEICITVADWKDVIGPMKLFSQILEKSPTKDLLSLLTEFNLELVEKHNFFQKPEETSNLKKTLNSKKMSKNSFSMTSTLTKTLFLP